MHYVYILQSQKDKSCYTGITADLRQRLHHHNSGHQKYTSAKKPYILKWYCAFINKDNALLFEKYLKTASGIAFARKRFLNKYSYQNTASQQSNKSAAGTSNR